MDVDDKNILWVDAENESIKTAKIPENLFPDWSYVTPREWNSKLSLFNNNGYQINIVWVLMNNNKNVWAKSQTLTGRLVGGRELGGKRIVISWEKNNAGIK